MASVPQRVRVVLADDTAEIRMLVRLGLELDGRFDVVAEAADGEAAVRACGEHQPDVAVLDLAMPVMDGLQAIPLVRRAAPGARIVVLSAFSSNQMAAEAKQAGADAYIEKGAATEHLVRILSDLAGLPERSAVPQVQPPTVLRPVSAVPVAEVPKPARVEPIDDVLEMIRHELRTPLTLASGFADLLARAVDAGDAAAVYERVEDVQRNIGHALRLLGILGEAQSLDEPPPTNGYVDVAELVRHLTTDFGALAADHRIVVSAPQRAVVAADADRITEILNNLVTNAVKYSPKGTTIEVTVASVKDHAEVAVRDEGPGVPEADQARVFERFARLHRDIGTSGMGLGLYLSRRIAHALGGELVLQRPGPGGSRFVLRLPLAGG